MSVFKFKKFDVLQSESIQKVGTDAMILGAFATYELPENILDIGTGTGVLALIMAQKHKQSKVYGLDIQEEAVSLASINFKNSPFSARLQTLHYDFLKFVSFQPFDLIISNPPYFNTHNFSEKEGRTLARHETGMTLVQLINHVETILSETGLFWMILPSERTEEIKSENLALHLVKQIKIYGKPNRHVRDILVFSKENNQMSTEVCSLTIRDENGQYSTEYKNLTKDFHYNEL